MNKSEEKKIQKAALIAGVGLLIMVLTVPFAEFGIFPKLVDYKDAEVTFRNISENQSLYSLGIFLHLITLVFDVIVAWALYIFLKPVNRNLSLLTAWFRLVFAALSLTALTNHVHALSLVRYSGTALTESVASQVLLLIRNHGMEWTLSLAMFGIYLVLLGILAYKAYYVPKIFGILLMIAGLGYLTDSLRTFFFPGVDIGGYLMITFFGELVFMGWLLIMGWRVKLK